MRIRRLSVIAGVAGLLLLPGISQSAFEMKLCEQCRRMWDDSPSRMRVVADLKSRSKTILVCSPRCLADQLETQGKWTFSVIQVVDWRDRDSMEPRFIAAARATYRVDINEGEDEEHARAPLVAAFPNEKLAASDGKALGGKLSDWDDLLKRCKKLAAEEEDQGGRSRYRPLRHRR
jgi:hypothetical protein